MNMKEYTNMEIRVSWEGTRLTESQRKTKEFIFRDCQRKKKKKENTQLGSNKFHGNANSNICDKNLKVD